MAAQRPAESLRAGTAGLPEVARPVPVLVPVGGRPVERGLVTLASGAFLPSGMVSCGVIVRSGRNSPGGAADSRFSAAVNGRVWRLAGSGADAAGWMMSTGAEAAATAVFTSAARAPLAAKITAATKAASRGHVRSVMALILNPIGNRTKAAGRGQLIVDNRP